MSALPMVVHVSHYAGHELAPGVFSPHQRDAVTFYMPDLTLKDGYRFDYPLAQDAVHACNTLPTIEAALRQLHDTVSHRARFRDADHAVAEALITARAFL